MSSKLDALLNELSGKNNINAYMMKYVEKVCAKGMDDEMCHEAIQDAIKASDYGVATDHDFQIFFYVEHFVDLEADEIVGPLSDVEKTELKKFMFSKRHEIDYSNLTSYRPVVLMWAQAKNLNKSAYPNVGGDPFVYDRYNLDGWKSLAHEVNKLVALGKDRVDAMVTMAKNLDSEEQADFKAWYDFNFGDKRRLYNINDNIRDMNRRAKVTETKFIKVASIFEGGAGYWAVDLPKPKPVIISDEKVHSVADTIIHDQKASDMNSVKTKMISRTFAIDKLLERYRSIFSDDQIDQIEDALNVLRKKIRKLKTASIINDIIIKTAAILKRKNFDEGASVLLRLAADPIPAKPETIDSKPDKANTVSPAAAKERTIDELTKEDLKPILDKLYDVSVRLKRRNIVREIAGIDLDLYNLNVASFFPELTDAQAKLIEAFGYASNKVEDVIPKLRSVSTEPPPEYEPTSDVVQELGKVAPKPTEKPVAVPPAAPTVPLSAPSTPVPATKTQVK